MATRNAIHILRNTLFPSQTLPASAYYGEPLVNLGDGIMFFSGGTSGSPTWVPSGPTGTSQNYFEVGSNLYNLKLRNQITHYNGLNNLTGKFLSGTTNGFVLADISDIASSIDSYTTGATWNPNVLTIQLNNGKGSVPVTIDSFNNLNLYGTTNVNGNITVTGTSTFNGLTYYNNTATASNEVVNYGLLTSFTQTIDVYVTGNTLTPATNDTATQSAELTYHGIPLGGPHFITTQDTFTTGGTYNNSSKDITFTRNDSVQYTVDLSTIDTNDTYVTGGTSTGSSSTSNQATIDLTYNQDIPPSTYNLSYEDTYTTGATLNGNTVTFYRNDGVPYSINLNSLSPSGATSLDTYVTGFTYDNANIITLSQNQGESDITVNISTLASITVNGNATVTGTTTTGNLIVNNPSGTTATIGQGGLVIGSGGSHVNPGIGDLTVHGNFTVFGTGTTIATNELYIEDPTITLNYNPSGSSTSTSVGSGIVIQDGSGTIGTDTTLRIGQLFLNGNFTPNTEYTSLTGNANRGFFTQLNDIIVRNTNNNAGTPDGKRLLAEDDILDGGSY